MRIGLSRRLLAPVLFLVAADLTATAWAAREAARDAERRIASHLDALANSLSAPTYPLTERVLEQMKALSGAEFVYRRPDGVRYSTFRGDQLEEILDVLRRANSETDSLSVGEGENLREYSCRKSDLHSQPNSGGTLFIFYPETLRLTAIRDAVRPVWLGGVGGFAAVVIVIIVGRRLTNRITELERRTRAIAEGDFRPMPLPPQDDEVRDLCRAVNDMANRLAEYQEALKQSERIGILAQFSGGLAHQLRNAAAGARLALQLHSEECSADDQESLEVALRQLGRIEWNLRQFLTLGRPPDFRQEPCDLGKLITQSVELLGPQCRHTRTRLDWTPPESSADMLGDTILLGHLLTNVIGNAVEAAGPDGVASVSLQRENGTYVIKVRDSGPGPAPEIASRLFEPFVTGKNQGIGLGLAVARRAAESHGGSLRWTRETGGTLFVMELPVKLPHEAPDEGAERSPAT